MPKRMGSDPGIADAELVTPPLEQFDQGMIRERLMPSLAFASHEKHVGAVRVLWPFLHDVITHGSERLRLKEINDAFGPGFRAHLPGVISPVADDHALASILNVTQLKVEHFTRPQSPLQHQEQHGPVSLERERGEQLVYLLVLHRTRHALRRFDA
jgi:hypothetical protein